MAVDQRGEQSAINIPRKRGVVLIRQEVCDRLLAIPVAFDLIACWIQPPAALALCVVLGVIVLESLLVRGFTNIAHGVTVAGNGVDVRVVVADGVTGVRVGVLDAVGVGGSPSTMKRPTDLRSSPTKICVS